MSNIKGLNSLLNKLDKLGGDITEPIKDGLEEVTFKMVGQAKQLARVRTGAMRNSIINEVEKVSDTKVVGQFGTNIEYAIFNELGTSKMTAQPFINPGFEAYKGEIVEDIKKHVLEELK